MLHFYHVYGTGHDPYAIEAVKQLDRSGYEYALTFMDKSPEMQMLIGKRYRWPTLPLVVRCDVNGDEEVIGGYNDLKEHLGLEDDCEGCNKQRSS